MLRCIISEPFFNFPVDLHAEVSARLDAVEKLTVICRFTCNGSARQSSALGMYVG